MASYTEHYQLHQWEPEDRFLRTDFNEDLEKIDNTLFTAAQGNCRVITGSYVGTGKYGKSSPNRLDFSFTPEAVMITGGSYQATSLFLRPGTGGAANNTAGEGSVLVLDWSTYGLSWYVNGWASGGSVSSGTSAEGQLNESGQTYYYMALGKS